MGPNSSSQLDTELNSEEEFFRKKQHISAMLFGSLLICVGYYLPWYSIAFTPPGGSVSIDGQQVYAFSYAWSGLNSPRNTTTQLLYPLILITFLCGIFDLVRLLVLNKRQADTINTKIASFFGSDFAGKTKDLIHALIQIFIALAWIGFLFLYFGLAKIGASAYYASMLGGSVAAYKAAGAFSLHYGIGLVLIFMGLCLCGASLFRQIGKELIFLLVIFLILFFTHAPILDWFTHNYLGF